MLQDYRYTYISREFVSQFDSLPLTYYLSCLHFKVAACLEFRGFPALSSTPALLRDALLNELTPHELGRFLVYVTAQSALPAAAPAVTTSGAHRKVSSFYLPLHFVRILLTI